jgi:hypothetical protein
VKAGKHIQKAAIYAQLFLTKWGATEDRLVLCPTARNQNNYHRKSQEYPFVGTHFRIAFEN